MIPQEHSLFRGLGNDRYEDVSQAAGEVLSKRTVARGACFADYDNDGKVDAFVVNLDAKGTLVHNISQNTGHWIGVKLVGAMRPGDRSQAVGSGAAKSNRDGIGARVEVFAGGKRWMEERVASSGYLSQNDARLHFGLGPAASCGQAGGALAQRQGANAGEACGGPRGDRGGAEVTWRNHARVLAVALAAAAAIAVIAAAGGESRESVVRPPLTGEHLVYASPVEMVFSRDGARLYVLCQGSDEIRVLDRAARLRHQSREFPWATCLAGCRFRRMARGFLSPIPGTIRFPSLTRAQLAVNATWNVGAEPSSVAEDRQAAGFCSCPTGFRMILRSWMRKPAWRKSGWKPDGAPATSPHRLTETANT